MSNNKLHDRRVEAIAKKPSLIGLDNIIMATTETFIIDTSYRHKGELIGAPDSLMFDPSTQTLYNIEYKTGEGQRDKAIYQLARNGALLQSFMFPWKVVDLYVHGRDFETEKMRYGHERHND